MINQEEMIVWYGHDNEPITLVLEKRNVSKITCWRKTLVESDIPIVYSISYNGKDVVCLHIWLYNNMKIKSENVSGRINILPDSRLSRVLNINQVNYKTLVKRKNLICTLFIDLSGDVVDTGFHPSLFSELPANSFLIEERIDGNDRRTVNIARKKMENSEREWLARIECSGIDIVLTEYNNSFNNALVVAQVTDSVIMEGEVILNIPKKRNFFQYYLAILTFDESGNNLWNSFAGPFTNGSVGLTAAHVNSHGEVFLIATFNDGVEYWKNNKRMVAINPRKRKVHNVYHGLNHGQALLVVDNDGRLLFSGILADGYLCAPSIIHIMPDQSLGFYARVGPRAQLVNNNELFMIYDNHPAPPPYIFLEISNAYWRNID